MLFDLYLFFVVVFRERVVFVIVGCNVGLECEVAVTRCGLAMIGRLVDTYAYREKLGWRRQAEI